MPTPSKDFAQSVLAGERFEFGQNWRAFLSVLDEHRIEQARRSLKSLLGDGDLRGKAFLDIGSGSGLMSLAARRLGMRVTSFDFDPESVACTAELRHRFDAGESDWKVLRGSVLDPVFMKNLGAFQIVYSWGVLHHTGSMWQALDVAAACVEEGGLLAIAIYNDQGPWSRVWRTVKRVYNRIPGWLRIPYVIAVMVPREIRIAFVPFVKMKPMAYLSLWTSAAAGGGRGMSRWYDWIDWVGGYPFEVAKPEAIFGFFRTRGFLLERLKTCGGNLGCNEFVFRASPGRSAGSDKLGRAGAA